MKEWEHRPPEIAALLNPAFCGFLIMSGVDAYTKIAGKGAPYLFPFLMLPLVLHKPTRQLLPRSTATTFSAWITNVDSAVAKIGFAERARSMVPYVKETLSYVMQNNNIIINEAGLFEVIPPVKKSFPNATEEINECVRAALMCGRWFSKAGDLKTTMALLGVKP